MAKQELNTFINKRYPKWMDYATYHASRAGIPHLAGDLLQEVLIMLLEKDEDFLMALLAKKSGQYTELDFYTLKLIKQNAHSPTSPFRYKEEKQRIDRNADTSMMVLPDEVHDVSKYEEELLRLDDVKQAIKGIYIGGEALGLFNHLFFDGGNIADYPSKKSKHELHSMYLRTLREVCEKLCAPSKPTQLNLF